MASIILVYFFFEISPYTVCPGSSDPFYVLTYYIKWVTTSWTYSILNFHLILFKKWETRRNNVYNISESSEIRRLRRPRYLATAPAPAPRCRRIPQRSGIRPTPSTGSSGSTSRRTPTRIFTNVNATMKVRKGKRETGNQINRLIDNPTIRQKDIKDK